MSINADSSVSKWPLKPTLSGVLLGITDPSKLSNADQRLLTPRLREALTQDVFLKDQKQANPQTRQLYSRLQNLSMGKLTLGRPTHGIAAMFNGDALKNAGLTTADSVGRNSRVLKLKDSKGFDFSQLSGSERLQQYLTGKHGLFSKDPQLGKELFQKIKEGADAEQSDEEICMALRSWYNEHAVAVADALGKDDDIRVKGRAALFQNFINKLPFATDEWKAKEGSILDVGCSGMEGTRAMVTGLLDSGVQLNKVHGIDIYRAPSLDFNRTEIGKLKTTSGKHLSAIPLLYEGVDHSTIPARAQDSKIITAMSVLHHVINPGQLDKLLGSIHDRLADDGLFIVRELIADDTSTKIFNLVPELKFYHAFEQLPVPMDVNCYRSVDQWKSLIEKKGFEMVAIDHNPEHPFEPAMMAFRKKQAK